MGDERSRLLPVLHTMLKFTDEELSRLRAIAASGMQSVIMQLGRIKGGLGWGGEGSQTSILTSYSEFTGIVFQVSIITIISCVECDFVMSSVERDSRV